MNCYKYSTSEQDGWLGNPVPPPFWQGYTVKNRQHPPIALPFPGRRTRIAVRTSKGLLFTVLALLGIMPGLPTNNAQPAPAIPGTTTGGAGLPGNLTSQLPRGVGADPVPDLRLPKTVVSSVDSLIGAGGVVQASPNNLTLYNYGVALRLLGGNFSSDQLLGRGHQVRGSNISWQGQVQVEGAWLPLTSSSSIFAELGTNSTGTYVLRSMVVGSGLYSGMFTLVYTAASGRLKWNLEFTPTLPGHYRLLFNWSNITSKTTLNPLKRFEVDYEDAGYIFSWNDVPASFNTTATAAANSFLLSIDLGNVTGGSRVDIDPYIATVSSYPAGYTFQRRVFFDSKGGNYWVFYNDGFNTRYMYSSSGLAWNAPVGGNTLPAQFSFYPSIYTLGTAIVVADGEAMGGQYSTFPASTTVHLWVMTGTLSGNSISWAQPVAMITETRGCIGNGASYCEQYLGIRDVAVVIDSTGRIVVAYNRYWAFWPYSTSVSNWYCGATNDQWFYSDSMLFVYRNGDQSPRGYAGSGGDYACYRYDQDYWPSILLASDNQGGNRLLYQQPAHSESSTNNILFVTGTRIQLMSVTFTSSPQPAEQIEGSGILNELASINWASGTSQFSAAVDAIYGTHVVYKMSDGTVKYSYRSSSWAIPSILFSGTTATNPTVTSDYSTNDVYGTAVLGSSLAMRIKPLAQQWSDRTVFFPVTNLNHPADLGSNLLSASESNAGFVLLVWTEGQGQGPFKEMFGSLPMQTVWSPYSAPSDPWDGNGLAPYGQYFANLGESVSPNTGMLAVRQTDLHVPGRGLDLDITRVYVEPSGFLGGTPHNYESYPWTSLGNGWQLNFPWMNSTVKPLYVHLWNGQGYRIPSAFWSGPTGSFENHQGEHFRLVNNSMGVFLYAKSGVAYLFDTAHSNRLSRIVDPMGNNITFYYNGLPNEISRIVDTVGRAFQFCYNGAGQLVIIAQSDGSCDVGFARRLIYSYSGPDLVNFTDPAGRITTYQYRAVSDPGVTTWLLSKIVYPTQWYSNYTYTHALMGTQATSYRVFMQSVSSLSGSPIRRFQYNYTQGPGDQVTNSTVRAYEGTSTQPTSYITYSYSFAGVSWNITDANRNIIRGVQQRFGVHGEVPKEIIIVSDGNGRFGNLGSYTNYYRYDLWGNLIYSRMSIDPSSNSYHETFNAYYNNGLSPGFNAFQETFSQNQGTFPDNQWSSQGGSWMVQSGAAFVDDNFTSQAWTLVSGGQFTSDGDIGTLQSSPTFGVGKAQRTIPGSLSTNMWPYIAWRARASMDPPVLRVHYTDGTETTDTHSNLNFVTRTVTLPSDKTIQWLQVENTNPGIAQISKWDFIFITNEAPADQFDSFGQYQGTANSGLQENNFIWEDLNKPDISIKANIYITQQVNTTTNSWARLGIFGHHPGTGNHKWALVLDNRGTVTSPSTYLDLLDEFAPGGWLSGSEASAGQQCAIVTNTWYTFNMTIHGLNAWGKVEAPSKGISCSVNGTYSSTSPAISGTGFGLYSGGYAALFDNVAVTTVSPLITGTSFSNSFIPNGAPNANIHGALAGTAELQNGVGGVPIGTAPIETYYSYFPSGRLKDQKQLYNPPSSPSAQWLTTSWTYDAYGNPATFRDARGNTTSATYSSKYQSAYLTAVTQTLVPSSTLITQLYGYNFTDGTRLWSFDPRQYNTTYKYDILGRPTKLVYPTSDYSSYKYNDTAAGNYVDITNENSWKTWQIYDGLGRLSETDRFSSGVFYSRETYTYNWMNKIVATTDPMGHTYNYQYDVLGRIVKTTKPDGNYTTEFYNDIDNWVKTTDENGQVTYHYYDRLGRLTTVFEPIPPFGAATYYYYDEVGNLRRVINAINQATWYWYDNLNSLTRISYPDGTSELYSHDNNGNLVTKTDRASVRTLYSYDALNRVNTASRCGTPVTSTGYTYDADGNLSLLLNQNATLTYSYDSRNRPLNETYSVNPPSRQITDLGCSGTGSSMTISGGVAKTYTISYVYSGELLFKLTYPDGNKAKYGYDDLGRVSSLLRGFPSTTYYTVLAAFNYYPNDQLKQISFFNGLTANYTYDALSRAKTITLLRSSETIPSLLSLTYQYNRTGTLASVGGLVNGVGLSEQYRYDSVRRLTNATLASGTTMTRLWYEYDVVGNRKTQYVSQTNGPWTVTSYIYNVTNNELLSGLTPGNGGNYTYSYDRNGSLKARTVTGTGGSQWAYFWDPEGRLLNVTMAGTSVGRYAYDGVGRRVESVESSSTIFYSYLATETLSESSPSSTDYFYAGSLRVAKVSPTGLNYYHTDALGSARLVTDYSGTVLFSDNYQPYGQDNGTPSGSETYKFTGKPVSQTTGLYYEYQRWYDPTIGRFISQDPLWGDPSNPQSLNRYSYVSNRPTTDTDPTGLGGVILSRPICPDMSKDFWGALGCQFSLSPVGDVVSVPLDLGVEGAGWLGPVIGRISTEDVISFVPGAMIPGGAVAVKVAWDILTSHPDISLGSDVKVNDWATRGSYSGIAGNVRDIGAPSLPGGSVPSEGREIPAPPKYWPKPGEGFPPARGRRVCGVIAAGYGLLVAGLFIPELAKNRDVLGNLTTAAIVEGYTVPMVYTLCYGAASLLGA